MNKTVLSIFVLITLVSIGCKQHVFVERGYSSKTNVYEKIQDKKIQIVVSPNVECFVDLRKSFDEVFANNPANFSDDLISKFYLFATEGHYFTDVSILRDAKTEKILSGFKPKKPIDLSAASSDYIVYIHDIVVGNDIVVLEGYGNATYEYMVVSSIYTLFDVKTGAALTSFKSEGRTLMFYGAFRDPLEKSLEKSTKMALEFLKKRKTHF